jgi:hypothetical protein
MARDLGTQGVHVAYGVVDAVIDLEWTRKRWPERADDFFIKSRAIGDEIWYVVQRRATAVWGELVAASSSVILIQAMLSVHFPPELRKTPPHEVVSTWSSLRADIPETNRFTGLLFDQSKLHRTSSVPVDEL